MKRRITIAVATLFAASALAVPAFAAGIGVDVGANVGAGVQAGAGSGGVQTDAGAKIGGNAGMSSESSSGGVDSAATASTAANADFNTILSSIGDESSAAALRTMTEVGAVTVIDVSETAGADASALGQAVEANAAQIEDVQASLQANAAVNAALEAKQVDVSQVLAANVAADGSLTVYVK